MKVQLRIQALTKPASKTKPILDNPVHCLDLAKDWRHFVRLKEKVTSAQCCEPLNGITDRITQIAGININIVLRYLLHSSLA